MYQISVIIAAAVGLSAAVNGEPAYAYAYDGRLGDTGSIEAPAPNTGPGLYIDIADKPIAPQPSDELVSSAVSDPAVWRLAHDLATQPPVAAERPAPTAFQDSVGSGALGLSMVGAGMIAWVFQRRREAEADEDAAAVS
jgi:hypothetical protein